MEKNKNPKISICIPTYEMKGYGINYLFHLLKSIKKQTYSNYEIVISDHSKNTEIEDSIKKITSMDIKYLRNEEDRGKSSCNINNAIRNSTGEIIKPLFQDDMILNNDVLSKIAYLYTTEESFTWGGLGFVHIDETNSVHKNRYPPLIPSMNEELALGVNTFGCPSVCFFKKDLPKTLFDENLVWLMDCEFYHRMKVSYGNPILIGDYDIAVRVWKESFTADVSDNTKKSEEDYVKQKHFPIIETVTEVMSGAVDEIDEQKEQSEE